MSFQGRAFVKFSYAKDPGMFLGKGNSGATRKVLSHLKYIGFRSRELDFDRDTKGLFNEQTDNASLKEFYKSVKDEPGLKHSNTVKIHKVIISLKQEDYEKYDRDFKDVARHVVNRLEERKDMKLEWVGAVHLKEGHPHTHLVIKSIGHEHETGQTKRLHLDSEDWKFMSQEIDRFTGRDQIYARDQALEQDRLDMGMFKELSKSLDELIHEGERQTQQARGNAERQQERKAERDKNERER